MQYKIFLCLFMVGLIACEDNKDYNRYNSISIYMTTSACVPTLPLRDLFFDQSPSHSGFSQQMASIEDRQRWVMIDDINSKKMYGMTGQQKYTLFREDYGYMVDWLLQHDDWPDEKIKQFSSEYEWGCHNPFKIRKYRHDLEEGLACRAQKRQEEQVRFEQVEKKRHEDEIERKRTEKKKAKEEERDLRQKRDREKLIVLAKPYETFVQTTSSESTYSKDRQNALKQTQQTRYVKKIKSHEVDSQTAGFLQAQGISTQRFNNVSGTVLQHELIDEVLACYRKTAKACFEYGLRASYMIGSASDIENLSLECIEREHVILAAQLNDYADALTEATISIGKGALGSVEGFVNLAMAIVNDPTKIVELVESISKPFIGVARVVGSFLASGYNDALEDSELQDRLAEQFNHEFDDCYATCKLCVNEFCALPTQQKIELSSKCLMDAVICGKCLNYMSKSLNACAIARVESGGCDLIEELVQAKVPENIAQEIAIAENIPTNASDVKRGFQSLLEEENDTVKKLATSEKTCKTGLSEKSETALSEKKAAEVTDKSTEALAEKSILGLSQITNNAEFISTMMQVRSSKILYKNYNLQKEIIRCFDKRFYQKELLDFCCDIEKTYAIMPVQCNEKIVDLICNPKHMFTYQLNFKSGQAVEGILGGGHIGFYYNDLAQAGLINILSEEEFACGCKALSIKHIFGERVTNKTIWPVDWTAQQIMEAIKEAFHRQIFFKETMRDKLCLWNIIGISQSDVKIQMFVKKISDMKLQLKTAYPYYEKMS